MGPCRVFRIERETGKAAGAMKSLKLTGELRGSFAGLEDIEFDSAGRLWGQSESGTRKYVHWATHFPYIFEIDVSKLRQEGGMQDQPPK